MTVRSRIVALLLAALATPATAQTPTTQVCQPIDEAKIAALFDRWNASLKTLDPDKVVANYADDAVLLPTVSNTPRLTQAERRDYFVHFLENKPVGAIDRRVVRFGCNDALDNGIYTFTFGNGTKVQARYTFVYDYRDGDWKIVAHHSSAMPERVPAP